MRASFSGLVSRLSPVHSSFVNAISFAPGGGLLVGGCGYEHTVQIWNYDGGRPIAVLHGHSDHVTALDFTLDGRAVVSGGLDGRLLLIDMASLSVMEHVNLGLGAVHALVLVDPDTIVVSCGKGIVSTWSLQILKEIDRRVIEGTTINALALHAARGRLALAGEDGIIRVWDLHQQGQSFDVAGHTGSVNSIKFSHDGRIVASGGSDEIVRLWNAEDGSVMGTLAPSEDAIQSVSFHPSNRVLASGVLRGVYPVTLWDVVSSSSTTIVGSKLDEVSSISFNPDGSLLACAANGRASEVEVWRVAIMP